MQMLAAGKGKTEVIPGEGLEDLQRENDHPLSVQLNGYMQRPGAIGFLWMGVW